MGYYGKARYELVTRTDLDQVSKCWVWCGAPTKHPYPRLVFEGKSWLAHRLSYSVYNGELLSGFVIDHLCSNKRCVNPDHLEQVTQGVNVSRAAELITHCPEGHEYTNNNTGYYSVKPGKKTPARYCKECNRLKYWKRKGGNDGRN